MFVKAEWNVSRRLPFGFVFVLTRLNLLMRFESQRFLVKICCVMIHAFGLNKTEGGTSDCNKVLKVTL